MTVDLNSILEDTQFTTNAIRAGQKRSFEGEHSEALFLTSSYVFHSAEEAANRFAGKDNGNVYSRYTNPTVRTFEERLAKLENTEKAVATSSGMAAILAVVMSYCKAGDHILCSQSVFGSTISLLEKYFLKFGIIVDYVNFTDLNDWQLKSKENSKMYFVESPSNPLAEVVDLTELAKIAKRNNCLLVVDNCFCTPALQQPANLGADIIVHSATKYIDGQGRVLGGAVCGSEKLMNEITGFIRTCGATLSPFNAWVFIKGLETLQLRMFAQSDSAFQLASWLENLKGIKRVYYAGLKSSPYHNLAKMQQKKFGAVLSFEIDGDKAKAWKFIDAMQIISITTNLGDTKSTISHPASTSHGRLTNEEREKAGIYDNLIRLSIGLEDISDLQKDLLRGIAAIA